MSLARDRVVCPHCGHEFTDDEMNRCNTDMWALAPEEQSTHTTCPRCFIIFWVAGSYRPIYWTYKTEEDFDAR